MDSLPNNFDLGCAVLALRKGRTAMGALGRQRRKVFKASGFSFVSLRRSPWRRHRRIVKDYDALGAFGSQPHDYLYESVNDTTQRKLRKSRRTDAVRKASLFARIAKGLSNMAASSATPRLREQDATV